MRFFKNCISKTTENSCRDLTPKPLASSQILFIARCADDMESKGIETTGIASVIRALLISVTFLAVLDHCALVQELQGVQVKSFFRFILIIYIINITFPKMSYH